MSDKKYKVTIDAKGNRIAVISFTVQKPMRKKDDNEFPGLWELLKNPGFDLLGSGVFRSAAGITSKVGYYRGTYVHKEFKLYIIKDYERLKDDENSRTLSKINNAAMSKENMDLDPDHLAAPEIRKPHPMHEALLLSLSQNSK